MSPRARQLALVGAALLAAVCWLAWSVRDRATKLNEADGTPPSSVLSRASDFSSSNELPEIADLADPSQTRADVATESRSRASDISVLGRVVDELGRPIERFGIRAIHRDANNWFVATREWPVEQHDAGEFDLTGLPAGRWEIAPYQDGLALKQPLLLTHAADQRLKLVMTGIAVIRGVVLDPDGNPVAGARVGFALGKHVALSGGNGVFEVQAAPGKHELVATSDEWLHSEPADVTAGTRDVVACVELKLRRGARLRGTAYSATGAPLAGWTLARTQYGQGGQPPPTTLDSEGRFELSRVPSGVLELYLRPQDKSGAPYRIRSVLHEGESRELDLHCKAIRLVRVFGSLPQSGRQGHGRLEPLPNEGEAVPDPRVRFETDDDGTFEFELLAPGRYSLALVGGGAHSSHPGSLFALHEIDVPDQDSFELVIDAVPQQAAYEKLVIDD